MKSIATILNNYGRLGVEVLKLDVQEVEATGKTGRSIHYEVESNEDYDRLRYLAREFFSQIETGRGPRRSSQYGGFDKGLLEYMEARGMVDGLSKKQKERQAKHLAYIINKYGDRTYREGGREVYSDSLEKLTEELTEAIKTEVRNYTIKEIKAAFSTKQEN